MTDEKASTLSEKVTASIELLRPRGAVQWALVSLPVVLIIASLVYMFAAPAHVPKDVHDASTSSNLYKKATVLEASGECEDTDMIGDTGGCMDMTVNIGDYGKADVVAPYNTQLNDVTPGTRVIVVNHSNGTDNSWEMVGFDHSKQLIIIGSVLVILMVLLTGLKGVDVLIATALSVSAIIFYLVPALVAGNNALLSTLAVSLISAFLIICLGFGVSWKTLTAYALTAVSATIAAIVGYAVETIVKSHAAPTSDLTQLLSAYTHGAPSSLNHIFSSSLIVLFVGILSPLAVKLTKEAWDKKALRDTLDATRDNITTAVLFLVFAAVASAVPFLVTTYYTYHGSLTGLMGSEFALDLAQTGATLLAVLLSVPVIAWGAVFARSHMRTSTRR